MSIHYDLGYPTEPMIQSTDENERSALSLGIGIVGLPNVGKSTLFNALTGNKVLAANYPFATIEPNTGVVAVPEKKLHHLSELFHSQHIVPATVTFVDIAGLVAGASEGEGLGNQFLGHIRSCSAIIQVVRAFEDKNVLHVSKKFDPKQDIETINTELVLADLQTVSKQLPKLEKEARIDTKLQPVLSAYQQVYKYLDANDPLWNHPDIDRDSLLDLQLITMKPVIYVFNVDEATLQAPEKIAALQQLIAPARGLCICASLEDELGSLEESEALELLASYGQAESGLQQLIHEAYRLLGLQSYFTAGEKEARAWTIRKGTLAPQAAGVIHGDFEKGFIAAEVASYDDLMRSGSWTAAKAAGKVRTEGKTYVMQEDDVVEFRFNVKK